MRGTKIRKQVKARAGGGKKTVTKRTKSGTVSIGTGSTGKALKKEIKAGKKAVKKMRKTQKKQARKSGTTTKGKVKPVYGKF